MKAIILASGTGKRLRPFTYQYPKSLISIGGKTILDYQLEGLIKNGVQNVIITTGPFREAVEEYVSKNYQIEISFVNNPEYEATNYIYTLWLVRDLIDSEALLLHGDLLFDDILIGKLIEAAENRVLVNKEITPPEKDFKALVEGDRIAKIGVEISSPHAYFCAPMYKFSKIDFLRWITEIDRFVSQGKVTCYAEDALNIILEEVVLHPLYFKEFCREIDTVDDLKQARTEIYTNMRQS